MLNDTNIPNTTVLYQQVCRIVDDVTMLRDALDQWTPNAAQTKQIFDAIEYTVHTARNVVNADWQARRGESITP